MCQQIAIQFHGIEMGQLRGQHARERAFARPDLDDVIPGPGRQRRDDAPDDVAVMQEMLAETLLGMMVVHNNFGTADKRRLTQI